MYEWIWVDFNWSCYETEVHRYTRSDTLIFSIFPLFAFGKHIFCVINFHLINKNILERFKHCLIAWSRLQTALLLSFQWLWNQKETQTQLVGVINPVHSSCWSPAQINGRVVSRSASVKSVQINMWIHLWRWPCEIRLQLKVPTTFWCSVLVTDN